MWIISEVLYAERNWLFRKKGKLCHEINVSILNYCNKISIPRSAFLEQKKKEFMENSS